MIRRPPRSTLFPTRRSSDLAFGIGFGAAQRGGGMLVLRALGTLPRVFHVQADAREFVLADVEFQPEAGQFTLHLAVAVHGGDRFAVRLAPRSGEPTSGLQSPPQ